MSRERLIQFFCIGVIVWIFFPWLRIGTMASGDWYYKYENADGIPPNLWSNENGNGFGGSRIPLYGLDMYYQSSSTLLHTFGIPWEISERMLFSVPYLCIGIFGGIALARSIGFNSAYQLLTAVIYVTNSYALMIAGGGQLGVLLAYALFPWMWWALFRQYNQKKSNSKSFLNIFIFSFALSAVLFFDMRIGYIAAVSAGLWIVHAIRDRKYAFCFVLRFFASLCMVCAFLSFWIIPFVFFRSEGFSLLENKNLHEMISYFSVSDFPHSISLLHPNWPENLFGKVYFMQAEFLLLPIIAYSALLFISKLKTQISKPQIKNHKQTFDIDAQSVLIVYFSFLALIGAFLAKGSNEPFGFVYELLYRYIPGFIMFRDPTKWYVLVAGAYSVLIPSSLFIIEKFFSTRIYVVKKYPIIVIIFLLVWVVLHKEAMFHRFSGTFSAIPLPSAYRSLEHVLKNDSDFSRVLWIPNRESMSVSTPLHPAVSWTDLFREYTLSSVSAKLDEQHISAFSSYGISYIAIPIDVRKRLFVRDRDFDISQKHAIVQKLDISPSLRRYPSTDPDFILYTIDNSLPLLSVSDGKNIEKIPFQKISASRYQFDIPKNFIGKVVFAQTYNPYWSLTDGRYPIHPLQNKQGFMEFDIKQYGNTHTLEYIPERYSVIGGFISIGTISGLLLFKFLWYNKRTKSERNLA